MKFVFFSVNNFKKDGGDTLRMYGVLNALAKKGAEVIFMSNASDYSKFNSDINHIFLNCNFSSLEKKVFQAGLSLLPTAVVNLLFSKKLKKISNSLSLAGNPEKVYFFEYLDNSLGYLLKKNEVIKSYLNDIHGVATVEFKNKYQNAAGKVEKISNYLKYYIAYYLDKKVFENADGFIFPSKSIQEYYQKNFTLKGEIIVLPNLLAESTERTLNADLVKKITHDLDIEKKFVIMFTGAYKATAGVDDLINAFYLLNIERGDTVLILIGSGPSRLRCEELVTKLNLTDKVFFVNNIPYNELYSYQSVADLIVCPDQMNDYSELIVHLKYFDALASGKVVINGAFKSVMEINKNEVLSLTFHPSDVSDLYIKMKFAYDNHALLSEKYLKTKDFVLGNLTYDAYIEHLIN